MIKLNDFLPDKSAPDDYIVSEGLGGGEDFRLITVDSIQGLLKRRTLFSHKGTYGHALIVAGARQTMGAALLSAAGCLYAGTGLTTLCIPESGLTALNTAFPEVMYLSHGGLNAEDGLTKYNALGIGPGLGQGDQAKDLLMALLDLRRPIVADADALNLLADDASLIRRIASGSVLSPHMNEFDRLFGKHGSWSERLETARKKAREWQVIIVLKNQFTFVIDGEGKVFINPTGNPAMAQGGMGDVLTGILTGLLAQGYTPVHAAVVGCYLHGLSGDQLSEDYANVTASQVARQVPKTLKRLLK